MRPGRPSPPRALRAALLLGLVAGVVAGCGEAGEERAFHPGESAREGIAVDVDGIDYEIFITRQLNVFDPEDKQYYQGRPAPPGQALFGVFLRACRPEDEHGSRMSSDRMKVVDIRGKEYRPIRLPPQNVFAYRSERLRPGQCIPNDASATAYGPTGGSMVLFQIPVADTENRPFELELEGAPPAPGQPPHLARFELDL